MNTKQEWFVVTDQGRFGPHTINELRHLAKAEKILPSTSLYEAFSEKTCRADQVAGLFDRQRRPAASGSIPKAIHPPLNNAATQPPDGNANPDLTDEDDDSQRTTWWMVAAVLVILAVGVTIGVVRMTRIQSRIEFDLDQIATAREEIETERQRLTHSLKAIEDLSTDVKDQLERLNAALEKTEKQRVDVTQLQQELDTQVTLNAATLQAVDAKLAAIEQKSNQAAIAALEQVQKEKDESEAIALRKKLSEEAKIALVRYGQQQVPQKQRLLSASTRAFGLLVQHWRDKTLTEREGKETMSQLRRNIPLIQGIEEIIGVAGDAEVQSADGRAATFREIWKEANKL